MVPWLPSTTSSAWPSPGHQLIRPVGASPALEPAPWAAAGGAAGSADSLHAPAIKARASKARLTRGSGFITISPFGIEILSEAIGWNEVLIGEGVGSVTQEEMSTKGAQYKGLAHGPSSARSLAWRNASATGTPEESCS